MPSYACIPVACQDLGKKRGFENGERKRAHFAYAHVRTTNKPVVYVVYTAENTEQIYYSRNAEMLNRCASLCWIQIQVDLNIANPVPEKRGRIYCMLYKRRERVLPLVSTYWSKGRREG